MLWHVTYGPNNEHWAIFSLEDDAKSFADGKDNHRLHYKGVYIPFWYLGVPVETSTL